MFKIVLFFFPVILFAQSIPEPVYENNIYDFIENLNSKAVVTCFTDVKPLTRLQIAEQLVQADKDKLSGIEQERLEFYKKKFAFEIMYMKESVSEVNEFLKFGGTDRLSLFKSYSKDFSLVVDPVIGIEYNFSDKIYHQFGGVQLHGRIRNNWGFYFNYRDNIEKGKKLDRSKSFTPTTGVNVLRSKAELIDYSETRGGITYGWEWGNLTAAKDFLWIGSSSQASVVLSDKAPSFPFIRLEVFPVDWFRYDFIQGWLNSRLMDSTTIRYTGVEAEVLNRSVSYSRLPKYYVSHAFTIQPLTNWRLTFGESIIYGDEIEFIYFLPVFYRLADHYNSIGGADSGDNAQLFFNTSYIIKELESKVYFTFYLDEFSPSDLFSGGDNAQVYALTLGTRMNNPLWDNSMITLEYHAVRPYNYMNADPLHSYESSGYQLGHWMGTNAVQIYAELIQWLPYNIIVQAYYNYVIKGEKENINDYYNRVTSTYPLLSGDNSYYSQCGLDISYNPIHDLFVELRMNYINIASGRFSKEYNVQKGLQATAGIRYGFQ